MKKSLKIVFFILVFSCMVCSCWLTFPFARIPVHKHDGNVVAFANKTSTERIKLIAKHTTSSVLNEKYGGVRTFYMHWDCDIECRANCTTPVKTMLIEILNSWDSILIIRDDTVRLEYIGCKMSNMGDSAHSIYNIDTSRRLNEDMELHFLEVPHFQKKPVSEIIYLFNCIK